MSSHSKAKKKSSTPAAAPTSKPVPAPEIRAYISGPEELDEKAERLHPLLKQHRDLERRIGEITGVKEGAISCARAIVLASVAKKAAAIARQVSFEIGA